MRRVDLPRPASSGEIIRALEKMAQEIAETEILEKSDTALLLSLPTFHRFYIGKVVAHWQWESQENNREVTVDLQSNLSLTPAGKTLLVLGALGVIPWILWTVIPPLIPLIPMGAIMLFLAWLAVGRPPHMFTEEMMAQLFMKEVKK